MGATFEERMNDRKVAKDTRTLADLIEIYCEVQHRKVPRIPAVTGASRLGVYGKKGPRLCAECEAHLAYGEKRRAFCPKDPKPFCANCDVHCYRSDEREWERQMMRFAGPRSLLRGHAIDGIKHVLETKRHKRAADRMRSTTDN